MHKHQVALYYELHTIKSYIPALVALEDILPTVAAHPRVGRH